MNKSIFRNIPNEEDIIVESWAKGVEWELTSMVYPDYNIWYCRFGCEYTGVVQDMIDNDNIFGRGSVSGDSVNGYTIRQIEDALYGQTSWIGWKHNIKIRYHNATEIYLDELFNYWN